MKPTGKNPIHLLKFIQTVLPFDPSRGAGFWRRLLLFLIAASFITRCFPPPVGVPEREEPMIRIGILDGESSVMFSADKSVEILDSDGILITGTSGANEWRITVKDLQPGRTSYILLLGSGKSEDEAYGIVRFWRRNGFDTYIQQAFQLPRSTSIEGKSRVWNVCLKKVFASAEEAVQYKQSMPNSTRVSIAREGSISRGTLVITNMTRGKEFETRKAVSIRGGPLTLSRVTYGAGFHWESQEDRTYPEILHFELNDEGKLVVINELPLEEYLKGVLPSEMSAGFPLEALKAQAIAARCEALAKRKTAHPASPYDLCANVHCQVYSGLTKRAESTDRAVDQTRGIALWKGEICNTVYSAVCGGHGEDSEKLWGGERNSYLKGTYDGTQALARYGSLSVEKNLRRWIDAKPPAFCNTLGDIPPALEYTRKYFRWEVVYSPEELRTLLESTTGRQAGDIIDLVALERGSSGRILRLRVIGQRDEYELDGELRIRRALSKNTLWSSCFYFYKRSPWQYVLKGAGFGHGVGMCQTGAAMMALKGKRFDQILKHYYSGSQIRRIY